MAHTAPGPAAGFLFQPERALWHLACGGELVGIETSDDVVRQEQDGRLVSEQAKHSLVGRNPFTDRSRGLWRTLEIWAIQLKDSQQALDNVELHLVTNAEVGDGLARTIDAASSTEDAEACVAALLDLARSLSEDENPAAQRILEFDRDFLEKLVLRIRLIDGSHTAGSELWAQTAERLHLSEELDVEAVKQAMLGWIHATCMEMWRSGRPAWIKRGAFTSRLTRVISHHISDRLLERTVRALPVSDTDRERHAHHRFVEQLRILEFPEEVADDYLVEAVNDYVRCLSERTRLLEDGRITGDDLDDFEERLFQRWKMQSRRHWGRRAGGDAHDDCDCGRSLYQDSIEHREFLAGVPTQQWYLTRGHLHRLADEPRIGWHPKYPELLESDADE
jgi:hypothetical protein